VSLTPHCPLTQPLTFYNKFSFPVGLPVRACRTKSPLPSEYNENQNLKNPISEIENSIEFLTLSA